MEEKGARKFERGRELCLAGLLGEVRDMFLNGVEEREGERREPWVIWLKRDGSLELSCPILIH